MANPTHVLIASQTLASSAASVTFSSIPQTYTDLVLRVSARTDRSGQQSDGLIWYYNTTSGSASASYTTLYGSGSAAASSRNNGNFGELADYTTDGATSTANSFGNLELYIPNYTTTGTKPASAFGVTETNATTAYMGATAALFASSIGAVTSLLIYPGWSTNFVSGSSFYLYGIKNS